MEKHVYFVRHGETDSNKDGLLRGPESALTPKGQEQARAVAERVKRIGVSVIISSSYTRTIETATAISHTIGLPVETSDLLVEWRQPSVMRNQDRRSPAMQEVFSQIHEGRVVPGYQHSDEESWDTMKQRALDALAYLQARPEERICVVTHGIFLRVLFGAIIAGEDFSGRDFQRLMTHLPTSNTGITYARYADKVGFSGGKERGWEVISWNDSAHLG